MEFKNEKLSIMSYDLIKDVLKLVQEFDSQNQGKPERSNDIESFKDWVAESVNLEQKEEPTWEFKQKGRSPESIINTLLVHLNRYAKNYSKAVIYDSDFSTQEDFIYLINLKAFGAMGKMDLIKKNVHEKSVGMQIINRLIKQGWIHQTDSNLDKRSKLINITESGSHALEMLMEKVRKASEVVAGDLNYNEKMLLIELLSKLNNFHHPIYLKNIEPSKLLDEVMKDVNKN